jgi:hypothetical protein
MVPVQPVDGFAAGALARRPFLRLLALDQLVQRGSDLLITPVRRVLVDDRGARGRVTDPVHQLPESRTSLRRYGRPGVAQVVRAP